MEEDIKILEEFIKYYEAEAISRKFRGTLSISVDEDDIEAIENLIKGYRELEEYYEEQNEVNAKFIPKSKIKEFFTSRLEKYQEADDGAYEQDYLTRGELELVDRYKECKEIAKILLEEEIEAEIPQDCIPKSKVKEKIEELNKLIIETQKELGSASKEYTIYVYQENILQDLLREE